MCQCSRSVPHFKLESGFANLAKVFPVISVLAAFVGKHTADREAPFVSKRRRGSRVLDARPSSAPLLVLLRPIAGASDCTKLSAAQLTSALIKVNSISVFCLEVLVHARLSRRCISLRPTREHMARVGWASQRGRDGPQAARSTGTSSCHSRKESF